MLWGEEIPADAATGGDAGALAGGEFAARAPLGDQYDGVRIGGMMALMPLDTPLEIELRTPGDEDEGEKFRAAKENIARPISSASPPVPLSSRLW